jgi:hypothetical protein
MLDNNVYRQFLNFIGWFVNLPLFMIGTILSFRALVKYRKKDINQKSFLLNLPMLVFSVLAFIYIIYTILMVVING